MPNHGENLLTFFELFMTHPSIEKKEKKKKELWKKKEKGCWDMLICLFVLLLWCGLDPYHGTRGTTVEALNDTIITYNDS